MAYGMRSLSPLGMVLLSCDRIRRQIFTEVGHALKDIQNQQR